ncbi:Allergen Fus c 3 [Fusarium oxysporum f. sp. rapae]|uniref:Allergen Fus c 3 n=1 Tax=Fusarium oxysporum f. sp. rapae TaxID=485398 RepID=A0A8J5NLP4_FUSOX|nr:Allergen Fus c 3 [Fusarium oxysporum f. sp. rapae]
MDEYLASEYFTNTFGSPGTSDLLEADLSMDCQPSLEMNLDYICPDANTEWLRGATSGPLTPPKEEKSLLNQRPSNKDISLPVSNVQLQLRSASRKSKSRKRRNTAPSNLEHARESHNFVEKHYRARLKTQFERLLAVLPAAQARSLADRDTTVNFSQVLSRGQVLDMARNRILELERKIEFTLNKRRDGYHVS